MDPLGAWVVKYDLPLKKLIRITNNRGKRGKYLINLPNGSNSITVTQVKSRPGYTLVYPSVLNGGYSTLRGEGNQYVEIHPRQVIRLLDGLGFLKKIDL